MGQGKAHVRHMMPTIVSLYLYGRPSYSGRMTIHSVWDLALSGDPGVVSAHMLSTYACIQPMNG